MNFNKPAPAVGFIQEYELFTGENGTYDVTLTLEGSGKVSLLYDSRRFILVNEEISGTREISFTASLCDKKFHGCDYEEKRVLTAAVFGNARIISAEVAPADRPTIYNRNRPECRLSVQSSFYLLRLGANATKLFQGLHCCFKSRTKRSFHKNTF